MPGTWIRIGGHQALFLWKLQNEVKFLLTLFPKYNQSKSVDPYLGCLLPAQRVWNETVLPHVGYNIWQGLEIGPTLHGGQQNGTVVG